MRAVLLVATVVVLLAFAPSAASASGLASSSPWAAYLAPPSACPGAERTGNPDVQRRALVCLINWTRVRAGLRRLFWSVVLARAANTKAATIASCGDFSHSPCGSRGPSASGRGRYARWGENLYYGSLWLGSPRAAMLAWLQSPSHRAVLLGRAWRDLGLDLQQVPRLNGVANVSLWVLEVGSRR
jgi:uncharacterized protein YkwD